jgi:hypothetical protein
MAALAKGKVGINNEDNGNPQVTSAKASASGRLFQCRTCAERQSKPSGYTAYEHGHTSLLIIGESFSYSLRSVNSLIMLGIVFNYHDIYAVGTLD